MPARTGLSAVKELDDKTLQCTRTGQVMLDFDDARSVMDEIRDYYRDHKGNVHQSLKQMYYSAQRRSINSWNVTEYKGALPSHNEIRWELRGTSRTGDITVDRYLLHHSRYLEMALLWIHKNGPQRRPVMAGREREGRPNGLA
jgi:hypothetical protein